MKSFLALALLVAAVAAAPTDSDGEAYVVQQDFDNIGVGPYRSSYQTSNGISANEEGGFIVSPGSDTESYSVSGSYSYTGDDGKRYSATYTAGEDGFKVVGDHIVSK